jgi:hypothetical protein
MSAQNALYTLQSATESCALKRLKTTLFLNQDETTAVSIRDNKPLDSQDRESAGGQSVETEKKQRLAPRLLELGLTAWLSHA